jgi:hypothetical protein
VISVGVGRGFEESLKVWEFIQSKERESLAIQNGLEGIAEAGRKVGNWTFCSLFYISLPLQLPQFYLPIYLLPN